MDVLSRKGFVFRILCLVLVFCVMRLVSRASSCLFANRTRTVGSVCAMCMMRRTGSWFDLGHVGYAWLNILLGGLLVRYS